MYIVQVCSGILPRYLAHYQITETGLTPVITIHKSKAMPLTDADAKDAFNRLLPAWPLLKLVKA
ncbi:conserved hypothetical protein [Vibrio chagasii]|uniref:hypothetical protein n=1 Tax=Vibrio TaxID=662 RepID=UPI000FE42409|nr:MULTISPECIES: hypothetical protein [Vibrio]CAK3973794.1 conserved hypothetical protein [Vibrio crassostreae]MDA0151250.1 hypothetical protein [Vibrio sp. Makdt]CAH7147474.1 conserved hypothetical protein [Vibrio chagasii]CAH7367184.1 conserved hypothetical protein [Vibrio chagasii]CAH7390789.1 conserved hypothetical protein [Vibrio chagasii]